MVFGYATRNDTLELLYSYANEVQERRFLRLTNGCEDRAERMMNDFRRIGLESTILVAKTLDGFPLEHESEALWHYHHVLYAQHVIYDPNYTQRKQLLLEEYASTVFPEQPIFLYEKERRKIIWKSSVN